MTDDFNTSKGNKTTILSMSHTPDDIACLINELFHNIYQIALLKIENKANKAGSLINPVVLYFDMSKHKYDKIILYLTT